MHRDRENRNMLSHPRRFCESETNKEKKMKTV